MAAKKKTKVEEPVVESVQEELKEVVETVKEEPKEVPAVSFGVVSDCSRLNVRKKPNIKAKVVSVITDKTKVRIDNVASNDEWCKVYVKPEIEGYCMRKYLTIQ